MNPENKFKVGDHVREKRVYFVPGGGVALDSRRNLRRGQVCEIIESTLENGYDCDEIVIVMDDLKTYSDFFYVFEFDIEKIREGRIDKLLV